MFKRTLRIKSTYLVLCSIVFGFITVASLIAELMGYDYFGIVQMVFMYAALIIGIVAAVQICRNWRERGMAGIIELLVLVFAGFFLFGYMVFFVQNFRMNRAISNDILYLIRRADKMMDTYVKENGKMPTADKWCDNITKDKDPLSSQYEFKIGQFPEIGSALAFNKTLSNLPAGDVPGGVVLLFETDGYWNFSGGADMMKRRRTRDVYFPFKDMKYTFILLADRTIIKYRLLDGAVATYIPAEDRFTEYSTPAESPYSPLKWGP